MKAPIWITRRAVSFQGVMGSVPWHISCEWVRAPFRGNAICVRERSQSRIMDGSDLKKIHNACPVSDDQSGDCSESRLRSARPVTNVAHQRILLATGSPEVELALLPIIRALDARIVQVRDAAGLRKALQERGTFDLVLSDSHLPGGTGLGILAIARQSGKRTPFIIVQSVHQRLIRVAAGGGARSVLSTRVVNDVALIELAEDLLGIHDAPASSRRSQSVAAKDARC